MIKRPGRQPSYMEAHLIASMIERTVEGERIVVHHITEDTVRTLQVEIERRSSEGVSFQRLILKGSEFL
jgi:hypothetical protein